MNLVKAIIYVRDISGIGKANDRKKQLPITTTTTTTTV